MSDCAKLYHKKNTGTKTKIKGRNCEIGVAYKLVAFPDETLLWRKT